MKQFIIRLLVLSAAVWLAAEIVPGIRYDNWTSVLAAALVLGILNTFVKPALRLLALPFIFLTLGFFLLVINAVLLSLAAWSVPGFHVAGFWTAVLGSLVISFVSMCFGKPEQRTQIVVERTDTLYQPPRNPPPGNGPIIDV